MHPSLQRLSDLLDGWIADPASKPTSPGPTRRPQARGGKVYVLPIGVRLDGQVVVVPGSEPGTEWRVDPEFWSCDCPAFKRWPPCKHVDAVVDLLERGRALADG